MNKIAFIIIGLVILYSSTIVIPVYCFDSLFSKWSLCHWFYNQPVIFYGLLIVLLIILNELVGLIRRKK